MPACTIQSASGKCGKPSVYTFTGRDGEQLHECADHYRGPVGPSPVTTGLSVGDKVRVSHIGQEKQGVVRDVKRKVAHVEVPLANGGSKVIARRIDDEIWKDE